MKQPTERKFSRLYGAPADAFIQRAGILLAISSVALLSGCGTGANLAGLSISADVAQKGQVIAATVSAGTNSITIGGSYRQGTNSYAGSVTAPTN